MIKVNLITIKRRKPIQIPFAAIFGVIAVAAILAGFYFATIWIEDFNKDKEKEKTELEQEIATKSKKFDERDRLNQQLSQLNIQIDQLKQLSGINLLQWSEVFKEMTKVVPEDTVWLTNLRIDSDRRVQMTGIAAAKPEDKEGKRLTVGIQSFINQLQGHGFFEEVFLTNANKNQFEKAPVMRFDITCRVKRTFEAK
ncbi:PilN domain-containing protein [bacterium]|nr:PilN domain-containing protein [bacterium]